jgi:hypothetical protein
MGIKGSLNCSDIVIWFLNQDDILKKSKLRLFPGGHMLIYSTNLLLQNSNDIETIFKVSAAWLTRKTRENISSNSLQANSTRRMLDGSRILTAISDLDFPKLFSIRYTHGDREVPGRQWITDIGIRQEKLNSELECSVLLRTDEISTRVEIKSQPTVPLVVHQIIKNCLVSPKTAGQLVMTLDNDADVEAFAYTIYDPNRSSPSILISPLYDKYFVDAEKVRYLVEGLADVIKIPEGADTFRMARVLGNHFAAWNGAVNIILPKPYSRKFVPTIRLMAEDLQDMALQGKEPAKEILSLLTHRVNLPNSWRQTTIEKVMELNRRRELSRIRTRVTETGETEKYIELLEEDGKEQDRKISDLQQQTEILQTEIELLLGEVGELSDNNRQLSFDKENLSQALSSSGQRLIGQPGSDVPDYIRNIFFDVSSKNLTPKDSLQVISRLFQDRVEILDSAWKSADAATSFKERSKLFELLWKLATVYWKDLNNGIGDVQARHVFGASYSAKESETASSNARATKLRTFNYKSQNIVMDKHLRIGVKPSPVETIRIHFEWLPDKHVIVIGYCGPHLDLK